MKILFCNITYLRSYLGTIEDDLPLKGGSWVKDHKDAHEKWNFLNYNGYCYGFVQNNGEFHLERLEGVSTQDTSTDGVTIVWCALNQNGDTVIVGWYENATVYRYYEDSLATPISGIDRIYFAKALAEDCYLLPEEERTYVIGRASQLGKGKGFGQQNYWYADSDYAKNGIIPDVVSYLNEHKGNRINRLSSYFSEPANLEKPLTQAEKNAADTYYDQSEYFLFLPLAYRIFNETKTADDAYFIGIALKELYQFDSALFWYQKVIEIEGHNWEIDSQMAYMFMQCEKFQESIKISSALFQYQESKKPEVRDEIYSLLADAYYNLGDIQTGIYWLDRIIAESSDSELIQHTRKVREKWM